MGQSENANFLYGARDEIRELEANDRLTTGPEPYRSPYRRDYGRLIHCPAFRRLQGKTQVFPTDESDFFRNRLTHSLEVAQIAKAIAMRLNGKNVFFQRHPINIDIVEIAGLAHDLGHPPFGHNGEAALDQCMKAAGGFEGNAQTFHILTKTEKKETLGADWNPVSEDGEDVRVGLNWAYRSLASIVKYDKIIPMFREPDADITKGIYHCDKPIFKK